MASNAWYARVLYSGVAGTFGYVAGHYIPEKSFWTGFVPLGLLLVAWPLYQTWVQSAPEAITVEPERTEPVLTTVNRTSSSAKMVLQETQMVGQPITLDECTTTLINPRRTRSVNLDIPVLAMREFVQKGWMTKFSSRKMTGMKLIDGITVTKPLWDKASIGMEKAGLIKKVARSSPAMPHSLQAMLACVLPNPLPKGWSGWK